MSGKEWRKVLCDTDWTNAWPTTAMWNTERLVKVQVADISANLAWAAKTDLGIHVGAIHIDLAAVLVYHLAHLLHLGFENAKGRRVRHHDCCKLLFVLFAFGLEFLEIKFARFGITLDGYDTHACHCSRCWVCSMS